VSWHLSHRWVEMPGRRGCFRIAERGRTRALWWYLACNARGVGTTGREAGVLHGGRGLVQHAQPRSVHPGPHAVADLRKCAVGVHRRPAMREHLGVHPADMGGSAVDAPGGHLWNSAALTLLAVTLRRSCPLHGHLPPARRPCPCLRSHDPKGLRNEGTRHGEARSRPDGCRLPEHGA